MIKMIGQRAIASLLSLLGLMVLVFFLSRLTGDPAVLFLPIDATEAMKAQFRALHGLDAPLIEQFGRYVLDLLQLDFGDSLRKARPAIDVVMEACPIALRPGISFSSMNRKILLQEAGNFLKIWLRIGV